MSCELPPHQQRHQKQSISIKSFIFLARKVKCKTQPIQINQNKISPINIKRDSNLVHMSNKQHDFPSIFTKQKRMQYSGYKHYNLNKSKFIKIDQQNKVVFTHKRPRNYEVNIKNIAKLRKRYSLQSNYLRIEDKQENSINKNTFLNLRPESTSYSKSNQTNQQIKLRQLMRNIILQNNLCCKNSPNDTNNFQDLQNFTSSKDYKIVKKNQHSSGFHRYNLPTQRSQDLQLSPRQNQRLLKLHPQLFKLGNQKYFKGHSKNEIKNNNDYSQRSLYGQDQEEELSGWQSQTFYQTKTNVKKFGKFSIKYNRK